jgi:hypothetical protein
MDQILGIFAGVSLLGIPVYFLNSKWRSVVERNKARA